MAKYWVYLNTEVKGPYELEQLIRLPGFSRQTMVSVDDFSGAAGHWISPAEIPELARIFQKVDELHDAPVPTPRAAPKPMKPRMPTHLTHVPPPVEERHFSWTWLWLVLLSALIGGGVYHWNQITQGQQQTEERRSAQTLVETAPLPTSSRYSTLRQYLETQQVSARWEFEKLISGLYNVTLSWLPDQASSHTSVYSFEVNVQAQSVRGLNTAAIKLLAEGFPAPAPEPKHTPPAPARPSSADRFPGAINDRRQAIEHGDFDAVWDSFSRRRQNEMEQGGIGQTGFVRMEKLTYKLSPGLQQTIVKTRPASEGVNLVLLRQTQPKHPDIYIKQRWIWEDNVWRLDNEEKKVAGVPTPAAPVETTPAASSAAPAKPPVLPPHLPGLSDPPATSH